MARWRERMPTVVGSRIICNRHAHGCRRSLAGQNNDGQETAGTRPLYASLALNDDRTMKRALQAVTTSAKTRLANRRLSHRNQPQDLDLTAWQRALRVQDGEEARFRLNNLEEHPVFSSFAVTNPESRRTYRVAIRGDEFGANFCSCPDFASNRLGVCKHIAFTLHRLRRRRDTARILARGYQPPYSEIAVTYDGPPRLRLLLGAECPPEVHRLASRIFADDGSLREQQGIALLPRLLLKAEAVGHELRVYDDAQALVAQWEDDAARLAAVRKAFPGAAEDRQLRQLLRGVTLHPYQCQGALFLVERGRALLADDMGLGKTAQAIAAALIVGRINKDAHVLVVAPASLTSQWATEIQRFAGIEALVVRGSPETRAQAWGRAQPQWKIVTYETLARDRVAIDTWGIDLLILDEAQRIKNYPTLAAQAVRRLDAPLRFVLTGTPMENRLDELHALVEVVDPQLLGPLYAFRDRHSEYEDDSDKVVGYKDLDHIASAIRPVLLRRTRAEVMNQLPGRSVVVLREPLTEGQRVRHDEDRQEVGKLVERWRRRRHLSESEQRYLRTLLTRMRMVCDDLYLLDGAQRSGRKLGQIAGVLDQELADPTVKVVIFSTWMAMHRLIREHIAKHGWDCVFLHGGVPSAARPGLIARFRDDARCRVFLSTDCGATGLNLQCATVLINVDLPWNPAVREQRISRIHRQGQKRPVRIYDLIAEDGIESGIAKLLTFKSALAAGVLDGGASSVRMNGSAMQRFMRTVEGITGDDGTPPDPAAAMLAVDRSDATSHDGGGRAACSGMRPAPGGKRTAGGHQPPTAGKPVPEHAAPVAGLAQTLSLGAQLFADLSRLASTARMDTDRSSGERTLRFPPPDGQLLASVGRGLSALQQALQAIGSIHG